MDKMFGLILFPALAFLAIEMMVNVVSLQSMQKKTEELYWDKVANYATDDATAEMLDTTDLDEDYTAFDKVKVNPKLALDAYLTTMCINLNMQPTDKSKEYVRNEYLKLLTVCAYDGYYVYEYKQDTGWTWSLKLPYTYKKDSSRFAINMGGTKCNSFDKRTKLLSMSIDPPISKEQCIHVVNERISDDLNYRLNNFSDSLYIPTEMTSIRKTNPIKGPSTLSFTSNSSFSIGGTKLEKVRSVVGYTYEDGRKAYSYADMFGGDSSYIKESFNNIYEAAKAGYEFDYNFMK